MLFGGFALLWNAASENRIDDLALFSDPLGVEGVDSLATFRIVLTKWASFVYWFSGFWDERN